MGLTVEEAKELMWMVGVMDGYSMSVEGHTDDAVTRQLEILWDETRRNPVSPLIVPNKKLIITE